MPSPPASNLLQKTTHRVVLKVVKKSNEQEQCELEQWCAKLRTALPNCFNGVDLFTQDTKSLLRNQPRFGELTLNSGKTKLVPINLAGRVSEFQDRWQQLDPVMGAKLAAPILPNWEGGIPPPPFNKGERVLKTEVEIAALKDLMAEYEMLGAIEKDPSQNPGWVMQVFPIQKKEPGSWRLISAAIHSNPYVHKAKFKQEGIKEVQSTLVQGDFLSTTDVKDAYPHQNGAEGWRKHYQFYFNEVLYRWCCLFFGESGAPRRWTKLILLPITFLREKGVKCVLKIDDVLVGAKSALRCRVQTNALVVLFDWLGLTLNVAKSVWDPRTSLDFIGYILETVPVLKARLTEAKAKKYAQSCKKMIKRAKKGKPIHLHDLQVVCGQVQSTDRCVALMRLKSNWLRWSKAQAMKSPDHTFVLPKEAIEELIWWIELPNRPEEMWRSLQELDLKNAWKVETDWSGMGLAACWVNEQRQVLDFYHEYVMASSTEHNNKGETRGITQGVTQLVIAQDWRNGTIVASNDNVVAVSYCNKQGGRVPELFWDLEPFFRLLRTRNLKFLAVWLAGEDNVSADQRSRREDVREEWALATPAFQFLESCWGPHSLDAFASATNTRLPRYFAWGLDVNSLGRDFFRQELKSAENLYANPPFNVIPKLLMRVASSSLQITLLMPFWPSRAWWPSMLLLLADWPCVFPRTSEVYVSARGERTDFNPRWSTIAVRLSGDPCVAKDFRKTLSKHSSSSIRKTLRDAALPWRRTSDTGEVLWSEQTISELSSILSFM